MNFRIWMNFNENSEQNWDLWCDTLEKYAQSNPQEKRVLNWFKDNLSKPGDTELKNIINISNRVGFGSPGRAAARIIQTVLKQKNIENYNWFCFALGCVVSYDGNIREEDLRSAIDETKRRISSRELLKSEIGQKGWLVIGSESKQYVDESIRRSQAVSKRQQEKLRKTGRTLSENPDLIKVFAEEDDFTLYFCPKLPDLSLSSQGSFASALDKANANQQNLIDQRHAILCKYGKGGSFCTATPTGTFHRDYINNDIYIFHVDNKVKYQFVSCHDKRNLQFMTVRNEPPKEIEKDEKEFLIKYGAPVECYKLKTSSFTYKELIDAAKNIQLNKSGISKSDLFEELSIERVETYLLNALENKKEDDIILLLKVGLVIANSTAKKGTRSQLHLKNLIEKLSLEDDSFAQGLITKIIDLFSSYPLFQYWMDNYSIEAIVKASDIENLKLVFGSLTRVNNILSDQDFYNLIEDHNNSPKILEIIAKSGGSRPSPALLIALSEDKQKMCNWLRTSGKIDSLTPEEITQLLLRELPEKLGRYKVHRQDSYDREILSPSVIIKGTSKEIASALGEDIISKISLPKVIVDQLYRLSMGKGGLTRSMNIESATKEQVKGFLEAIADKHKNLDREDVLSIITTYKGLGVHKASEKISKILGAKNLKKLKREDKYLV